MAEVKKELKPCPFCGAKAQMLNYSKMSGWQNVQFAAEWQKDGEKQKKKQLNSGTEG